MLTLEEIPERAGQILSDRFNGPITVEQVQVISAKHRRNRIVRIFLDNSISGAPKSLIIKQPMGENYDPADVYAQETVKHFNDWAGVEFLSNQTIDEDRSIAPKFYGGHYDLGYIMEDLGSHKRSIEVNGRKLDVDASLMGPLLDSSTDNAIVALDKWIKCLGRMHCATIGKEKDFNAIRERLGNRKESSRVFIANWFRENISTIKKAFQQINFIPDRNFYDEFLKLSDTIANPGPFLCFTHGDPCPDNCSYVGGNLRLIDFEIGSFQHALLDAVYARIAFPTCGCCGTIPENIVNNLEVAYREKLVEGCPEASDDKIFSRGMIDACAFRTMTTIVTLAEYFAEDRHWGIATQRQRIITRLGIMAKFESNDNYSRSIIDTSSRLASKLSNLWADTVSLPFYPAFQNG